MSAYEGFSMKRLVGCMRHQAQRKALLFSFQILASIVGCLATNDTYSYHSSEGNVEMLPVLPPYCRNAQRYRDRVPGGSNRGEIERWNNLMGKSNFIHIHHYCFGLEFTHRALKQSTARERDFQLQRSIAEFDYVLARATPDFVLLPEILTKRGENLLRLERAPEAIHTLLRAIEMKEDYWPPYAALSDHYKRAGKTEEARAWLEKGLATSPGASALQRRLKELPRSANR